jgi:hypothetical protein
MDCDKPEETERQAKSVGGEFFSEQLFGVI